MRRATVVAVALMACSSSAPQAPAAPEPEQESAPGEQAQDPQALELPAAGPQAFGAAREPTADGWRTLLPAPPRQTIVWATSTSDGRVAAMTPEGPKVVRGDRWVDAPRLRIEQPVHDAFEVRDDCHIVRRRDRRDYGPPRTHDYHGHGPEQCIDRLRAVEVFEGADGHPIALVSPSRHVLRWRTGRRRMGHVYPDTPDGPVGLVVRSIGGGWQGAAGQLGSTVVSVVPLDPPALVGAEGDVSVIESGTDYDRGRTIVAMQRPRPLLVLELDDAALLVARADGLFSIGANGAVRSLTLDDDARAWLQRTARSATDNESIRPLGASLGRGRAIIGAGTGLVYVDGSRTTYMALGESGQTPTWVGEVWGLVAGEQAEQWFLLTHNGVVVQGTAATWRRIGSLSQVPGQPVAVSHPIGAFRGNDGRPRFVAFQRPIVCHSATGLQVCGPQIDIRLRRVSVMPDGLLVDDQSIDLHVVTSSGSSELPLPLPRLQHAFVSGRADAPYALTDGTVQRLQAGAWSPVTSLPERASQPVHFTVTSNDALIVGLAGGEIIVRR